MSVYEVKRIWYCSKCKREYVLDAVYDLLWCPICDIENKPEAELRVLSQKIKKELDEIDAEKRRQEELDVCLNTKEKDRVNCRYCGFEMFKDEMIFDDDDVYFCSKNHFKAYHKNDKEVKAK